MFRIFNDDMSRRLSDLWRACGRGRTFSVRYDGALQPARIIVDIAPARRFALAEPFARQVAAQLIENKKPRHAAIIEQALPSAA